MKIEFGNVSKLLLVGGGEDLYRFACIARDMEFQVVVYSGERHLSEVFSDHGPSLRELLANQKIETYSPVDINSDEQFLEAGKDGALGLGFGETWNFTENTIGQFDGIRLLDIMRIPLPEYRGGAHYTWQILRGDRRFACHLQIINKHMVQGEFDSGGLVKSTNGYFSEGVRTPAQYFDEALAYEIEFLVSFLNEIKQKHVFYVTQVPEEYSVYFPRLHTLSQAYVDWSWSVEDIDKFVCAFDSPYPGASTFLNNRRVFLKNSRINLYGGDFHPFQRGLVYRVDCQRVYIACNGGTLIVDTCLDEDGHNFLGQLKVGDRFFTPSKILEQAALFRPKYDGSGLIEAKSDPESKDEMP